jgi:hypothetical protein
VLCWKAALLRQSTPEALVKAVITSAVGLAPRTLVDTRAGRGVLLGGERRPKAVRLCLGWVLGA